MKILPINNILNINKNHNHKPSFKAGWIEDANSYGRVDSYIDETGMHYVRNRVPYPLAEQINDVFEERPLPKNPQEIKRKAFLTQEQYDEKIRQSGGLLYLKSRKPVMEALYNMNVEELEKKLNNLDGHKFYEVTKQPFFMLGLADIPLNNLNKDFIQRILSKIETTHNTVNIMDENGITLLEKVINAENEPYIEIIKRMCNSTLANKDRIAYDPMQKYAFDNIRNPEFKEKCKDLPVKFFDIIDDIERKDLKALDKDIQEQMKCGFCNIQYALRESLYYPAIEFDVSAYPRIVLDIAKKHFPDEVKAFAKKFRL